MCVFSGGWLGVGRVVVEEEEEEEEEDEEEEEEKEMLSLSEVRCPFLIPGTVSPPWQPQGFPTTFGLPNRKFQQ